jgi:FkbM family methyltransferase
MIPKTLKSGASFLINDVFLKPLGLRLSFSKGRHPWLDMKHWLGKRPVRCAVDGGAYLGDFSADIRRYFPSAQVYAFEPQKDSFRKLSERMKSLPQIHSFNYALGAASGQKELYKTVSPLSHSLLQPTAEGLLYFRDYHAPKGSETVTLIRLDDFLLKQKLPPPDILKLDLQGYELEALKGLGGFLSEVRLIYLEVSFVEIYQAGPLFCDVSQYLGASGFSLRQFYGLVTSPLDGRLLYGDAVFVNKKHL